MPPDAIAIVPAHDEAARISGTLKALWSLETIERVLVVDDSSRDGTAALAKKEGAEVLDAGPADRPCGKGRALVTGIERARSYGPEAILIADADLGASAKRLSALVSALSESSPVAIATFPPATGAGFGLVKDFARREISRRTGYSPAEPLSGQRALLVDTLDLLPGIAPGFGAEVGMTLDLLAAGVAPLEVSLPLEHRATGRTLAGFTHRARQGFDIMRALRGKRIPW